MEKVKILKEKIEELRGELNQAVENGLPSVHVYEKSVALDKILEEYLDIVAQNE